ncbi:MAG: dTMP kinase [Spirochaetia bacterium]|nr:dTMP kinase [Spirochaetia bacterium]
MMLKNFIVFEGIDGSGTTTQIKKLAERFPKEKVFVSAEPTKNETGLFLRRMLKGEFSVNEKTASFLFAADRCEHLYGKNGILEQIQNGKIALSDRYFFSSLAYQSVSCGKNFPEHLNSLFPLPEILFYFKINPEISINRVTARGEKTEIYEKIEFQKKTADIYDQVINSYKQQEKSQGMKIITIDAEKPIDEISEIIWSSLKNIPIN